MPDLTTIAWELHSEPTDPTPPRITFARVDEELNEPYDVRVSAATSDLALEVPAMLGKDATVVIKRDALERRFCGIIQEVEVEDEQVEDTSKTFSLRLRPAIWMLSLNRDSRIFQKKTVPAIVKEVLEEGLAPYKRTMRDETQETYPEREYCVQYQESDLDFVSRLMEEEGISFAFDQEGETEVVVLRDKNDSFPKVKTLPTEGELPYNPEARTGAQAESVFNFQLVHQNTTTKVMVRDADFTRGDLVFDDKEGAADKLGRTRESYEHGIGRSLTMYDYSSGTRTYQQNDAPRQKLVRHQLHVRDAIMAYAADGDAIGLAPGTKFKLGPHPTEGTEGEYVVTRVCHTSTGAQCEGYANSFNCIPIASVFRPSRTTPKPRIASIQTAIVTGPNGEEIHVDEYGRVKVQFHWDRKGQKDDKTSCWIRTQQTWAGKGFGTWWVPRIGMEVIVQFIDGDPDRPLVTGCVYNADNQLPYAMPDEKTKSTIKSNSTIGGGGFNEFRFEDKKGEEEIWLHAQKDLNEKVLNNHTLEVGKDETITVKGNQTIQVDGNRSDTVTGNETKSINGSMTESITAGQTQTINGGNSQTVNGGNSQTISGGNKTNISGGSSSSVSGGAKEKVMGGLSSEVIGGIQQQVLGDVKKMITGMIEDVVSAAIKQITPKIERLESESTDTSSKKTWLTDLEYGVTASKNELNVLQVEGWGVKTEGGGVTLGAFGLKREAEALKSETSGVTTTGSGLEVNMDGCRIIT